jgi:hypothetical protein
MNEESLAKGYSERHLCHLRCSGAPEPSSSARARLLAVYESGPRLSHEDAEMLNRVIQEARDACINLQRTIDLTRIR